jgi:hypothetical protein
MKRHVLFAAAIAAAPVLAGAECTPTTATQLLRVTLEPPAGVEVAGVVLALSYPTDTVVIPGRGAEAGRAAVSGLPAGAAAASDDREGELRQVVATADALPPGTLFEVTFRRCEGAKVATESDFSCRVIDASDAKTTKVTDARCRAEPL